MFIVADDIRYKLTSGGGLTMLRNGTHYLYGIMSTFDDLEKRSISLFTNVLNTTHLDWIQQQRQRLLVLSKLFKYVINEVAYSE